jgi:large subunit ribosomal protein L10
MPPRLRLRQIAQLADLPLERTSSQIYTCTRCTRLYATAAPATTPVSFDGDIHAGIPPLSRYPPSQPPSHRNPAYRKSQLLRSYVSLLQTTPLVIFFQHTNLKASEWVAIRRELTVALRKLDAQLLAQGKAPEDLIAEKIKLEVVKTNMMEPAMRITEYFKPSSRPVQERTAGSIHSEKEDPSLTHALSTAAYKATRRYWGKHPLSPLLQGNIAILTLPTVSPVHLKTAFSILSPQPGTFPAPTRRAHPNYHDPTVQDGLKKLLLLGARVDGQVFDMEGARWVGSIDGGITGLRAQLVNMLQGFGAGLVQTLESGSRAVWWTMESRRKMLEDESAPQQAGEKEAAP